MAYRGTKLDNDLIRRWRPSVANQTLRRPELYDTGLGELTQVDGLWVPRSAVRESALVRRGAAEHPRGLAYDLDALTRMRITHLRRPDWIAHSWSAARVWGLPYFCDDADTCVLSGGRRRSATAPHEVSRFRREGTLASVTPRRRVDGEVRNLHVTPPALTIVHCLQSVRAGDHAWRVVPGTCLDVRTLRSVQVVDAMCALFGCDPARLVAACADHYPQRDLARIVAVADRGAESPMETVMRLQVRWMFGDGFISQLVIRRDGTVADPVHTSDVSGHGVVARVDLASPTLKLALQYDGSGHLERSRRDADSRVTAALTNLGWHVLRLTYGHLTDPDLLRRTVEEGVAVCRRRML